MKEKKVKLCSIFKTKEEEELFFRYANEAMFKHMNDEVSCENKKQKTLNKRDNN